MNNGLSQLTLIGTVHRDPQGQSRLAALLDQLQPDLLTLEMSPFAQHYRQTRGRPQLLRLERILVRLATETGRPLEALQSCQAVVDIYKLLAMPFEYQAAREYADRCGCRLELVDLSEVSVLKLKRVESGLITYRNLKVLTSLPEAQTGDRQESYAAAQSLLLGDPGSSFCRVFLQNRRGAEGIGPRDQVMAEQIRRLYRQGPDRHLVHIGGWVHLVEDPQGETLFSRLCDLSPARRLLVELGKAVPSSMQTENYGSQ